MKQVSVTQRDDLTSQWQCWLFWQELHSTVQAGDIKRTGGSFDTLYYTSDLIRVKGLNNDLLHNDQQCHDQHWQPDDKSALTAKAVVRDTARGREREKWKESVKSNKNRSNNKVSHGKRIKEKRWLGEMFMWLIQMSIKAEGIVFMAFTAS